MPFRLFPPQLNTDRKNTRFYLLIFISILGLLTLSAQAQTTQINSENTNQRLAITKQEAKLVLLQNFVGDKKSSPDPLKFELATCFSNEVLNGIFLGRTIMEKKEFETRFHEFSEKIDGKDPKTNLMMLKCISTSKEVEKAVANGSPINIAPPPPSTPLIDIDDLRADIQSLDGKTVRVAAIGTYMMDSFFIRKKGPDASPIPIDITKLPRDQRREIISQCGDIMAGCRLTILGVVSDIKYRKGLIAQRIELQ